MAKKPEIQEEKSALELIEQIIKERETPPEVEKEISFLKICTKCEEVIEEDITTKSFENYLNRNVIVKPYMALNTKKLLINAFFLSLEMSDNDFADLTYLYEVYSVLYLLLSYTNIVISSEEFTEENYELVMASGLMEYIQSKCGKDYELLCKMVINGLSFRSYEIINNFASLVNIDEAQTVLQDTRETLNKTNTNNLQLMKEIMEFNNPTIKKVKDIIYSETTKIIDKQSKKG